MAAALRFVCGNCQRAIVAYPDWNPGYGEDWQGLCLACGAIHMVDHRVAPVCPDCGAVDLAWTYDLGGQPCPHCKGGTFAVDSQFRETS